MFSSKKILEEILENQKQIIKKIDLLERKILEIERGNKDIKEGVFYTLRNTVILYGKSVLTRLNFLELSEGKPITVSVNEQKEIENSFSEEKDPNIFALPQVSDKSKKNKIRRLN